MSKLTRRGFLGALGAAATLPAWFPRLAFAAPGRAASQRDTLVCIFLRGGADGVNVVVPFGDSHYYDNRPTIGIHEPGAGPAGRSTSTASSASTRRSGP